MSVIPWLDAALAARLDPAGAAWLSAQVQAVTAGSDPALAVSRAGRPCGPALLAAESPCAGWDVSSLDVTAAARIRLVLAISGEAPGFTTVLDRLFKTATLAEAVALYRGLPAYPYPAHHVARAAEGVRSNMRAVYEAVALGNPYPAAHFDEMAWNQMVLKAFFVGAEARRIVGQAARWNPRLHTMLSDYARERHAAARLVDPFLTELITAPHPSLAPN